MGWEPIALPLKSKHSKGKWGEPVKWTGDSIDNSFGPDNNLGIALGQRSSNLVDIDFDWPEAALVANVMLSYLPSFGRAGSPHSHRIVTSELQKNRYTFEIPDEAAKLFNADRKMVLEIRGAGHQTMFPPSIHPTGELVRWHDDPVAMEPVEGESLRRICSFIAFMSVILNRYPKVSGNRDEICMALTGTLIRADFSDDEINRSIEMIAELAGDEEAKKRGGKAVATREKIASGEQVWSLPQLCEQLDIVEMESTLRVWLGGEKLRESMDGRPEILVFPGGLPQAVDQAEQAIIAAKVPVYQRFDSLVRVVRLPDGNADDGVRRANGALILKPVVHAWLKERFAMVARWVRPGKEGKKTLIDPSSDTATAYLARVGDWKVPFLQGVTQTPTLRSDGTVLQTPGYDKMSALLYDPGNEVFPEIPESPSKEEAETALEVLARPFREFSFAQPVDKSVALAAILTALVRRMFPSAPLFLIEAPAAGTGKSLFSETLGIIVMGHKPAMMSQGKTAEEQEKRLSSVLMAGDLVIVIDNCDRPIEGDFLCSMLTQEWVQPRILGKSEVKRLATRSLVIATGNNPILSGSSCFWAENSHWNAAPTPSDKQP